jgi:ribonuclease E
MGGVIVIDFIDLRSDKHRRAVEKAMNNELKRDRARSRMLRISRFGLLQITRQRVRQGTKRALYQKCGACGATGLVPSATAMVPHIMRRIRLALSKKDAAKIEAALAPELADEFSNAKRAELAELESASKLSIRVTARSDFRPGQCQVICYLKSGKKTVL